MIIKQIKLENFRQFKGDNVVKFSTDEKRNVTVILGNNTFGKTTILQAFNWCFYEVADLPKNDHLLNYDIETEMASNATAIACVEIVLEYGGYEYLIRRSQTYFKDDKGVMGRTPELEVSQKTKSGQMLPLNFNNGQSSKIVKQNFINKMLPQDLSAYFFFDTERVSKVGEGKNISKAVKEILGLDILSNAIKHLGSRNKKGTVINKFYEARDNECGSSIEDAQKKIDEANYQNEKIKEKIEHCNTELNAYNRRKEELKKILREGAETAVLQKNKENLEGLINAEEEKVEQYLTLIRDEFGNGKNNRYGALRFFAQPLLLKAKKFLKEAKVDDKGIRELQKPTIDDILKRGVCLCGCDLKNNEIALQHINELLKYIPPENLGSAIRTYQESLDSFCNGANTSFSYIKEHYGDVLKSMNYIRKYNSEIEIIDEKINGAIDMEKYVVELADVESIITQKTMDLGALHNAMQKNSEIIRDNEKIIDSLAATYSSNVRINRYIAYSECALEMINNLYNEQEKQIRDNLVQEVNSIFNRMYHGKRKVKLQKDYEVILLAKIGDREIASGESEGLNRVKNFAFIAGLVSLARKKIRTKYGKEDFYLSEEPYPLVMDAPFSNADEEHTRSISKELPEVAEQIIMFVMHKDWSYAENELVDRLGLKYELVKISESHTKLREI